jgi:hypothetical protein
MTPTRLTLFLGAVPWVLSAALAGCSSSGTVGCRTAADCASGACRSDGTCEPVPDAGSTTNHILGSTSGTSGTTGASTTTGSTTGSSGATTGTSSGTAGSSTGASGSTGTTACTTTGTSTSGGASTTGGTCHPNHDGTITRAEEPFGAGLRATYRIATSATPVDTVGTASTCGQVWDLTGAFSSDTDTVVTTDDPSGAWWAADFPSATYASQLSSTSPLLGVFQATADQLVLLGVVSPTKGTTYTELSYSPAVVVLQFPITATSTWSTAATVTGYASGVNVGFYDESYTSAADATGTMKTPFADFPVVRIHTDLSRLYFGITTTSRTYLFVTECFGTVATMVSKDNESAPEFTTASEVRRLAP